MCCTFFCPLQPVLLAFLVEHQCKPSHVFRRDIFVHLERTNQSLVSTFLALFFCQCVLLCILQANKMQKVALSTKWIDENATKLCVQDVVLVLQLGCCVVLNLRFQEATQVCYPATSVFVMKFHYSFCICLYVYYLLRMPNKWFQWSHASDCRVLQMVSGLAGRVHTK